MKPITIKLASGAMTALSNAEKKELFNPIKLSVLEWYQRVHEKSIPAKYHDTMSELIEENLSVFHMVISSALRRYVLSTATVLQKLDGERLRASIIRELDLNLASFQDDAMACLQGTELGGLTEDYDEVILDIAEQTFGTAHATVTESLKTNFDLWETLLVEVYAELWATAGALNIICYLSDSDNVVFVEDSPREETIVYAVKTLPTPVEYLVVGDLTTDEGVNAVRDFIDSNLGSPLWSDDFIFVVNGKASHPDLYTAKTGDTLSLHEVDQCKH